MRFLHTSDWHLGRSFHGMGMQSAQQDFVDQLVAMVEERNVDVVLIAGDVYDRALPGVDVVNLLDDALVRLTRAGAKVVMTSGNHDSAIRLGFAARLLEHGGVHVRTRVPELDQPLVLPLSGPGGTAQDGAVVAVYGTPWLEPRLVAPALGVETATHYEVTKAAMALIRDDVARRSTGTVVHPVVMCHTFASGGITSDSERDLNIGGVGAVPLDLFDGFTYTALGHLHGRQALSPSVRYSGSPLAYSFSEASHRKGAWLVDIGVDGLEAVEEVNWEAPRALAVLRGRLSELLESESHTWAEEAYCQVTLTDAHRPAQAMDRLRKRFPDTLVLNFDPEGGTIAEPKSYSSRLAEAVDDLSVCCGFLEHVRARPADPEERAALAAALETVRLQEASL